MILYFLFISNALSLTFYGFDQITSSASMLSFKGSPYWMAPEVSCFSYSSAMLKFLLKSAYSSLFAHRNYFIMIFPF